MAIFVYKETTFVGPCLFKSHPQSNYIQISQIFDPPSPVARILTRVTSVKQKIFAFGQTPSPIAGWSFIIFLVPHLVYVFFQHIKFWYFSITPFYKLFFNPFIRRSTVYNKVFYSNLVTASSAKNYGFNQVNIYAVSNIVLKICDALRD